MNTEQQDYIDFINQSPDNEIFIKETGWEEINLPGHSHAKYQVIHTLSGTLHIQAGTASYFVPEHHIAWIPKDMMHELSSNNRQISLQILYCALHRSPKDGFAVYNTNTIIGENLKFIARNGNVIRKAEQSELYDYAVSFLKLLPRMGQVYQIPLQALVVPDDARLRFVLRYINEHLQEELSMESIAAQFGFSVRNLSRLFQKSDIRFTSYLNYQRITRAIELFADRDKTMQQIAYEVGFNTPNNFNRVFKQMLGTSPGAFYKRT